MDVTGDLGSETKRTEEEIRKAEMRKEIGELKEVIDRTGHMVSRELQAGAGAPSATADDDE